MFGKNNEIDPMNPIKNGGHKTEYFENFISSFGKFPII